MVKHAITDITGHILCGPKPASLAPPWDKLDQFIHDHHTGGSTEPGSGPKVGDPQGREGQTHGASSVLLPELKPQTPIHLTADAQAMFWRGRQNHERAPPAWCHLHPIPSAPASKLHDAITRSSCVKTSSESAAHRPVVSRSWSTTTSLRLSFADLLLALLS